MRPLARPWILLVFALVLVGCGGRGGESAHWVPAETRAVAYVPQIDVLRARLGALLAGIEGASGALDLLEARVGLDLRTREGLESSGIDPDASLSLFAHQGGLVLALGIVQSTRFHDRVARQISRLGQLKIRKLTTEEGVISIAEAEPVEGSPSKGALVWGTGSDGVGCVLWHPDPEAAQTQWVTLAQGRDSGRTLRQRATTHLDQRVGAYVSASVTPTIPSAWGLGPANMVLLPILAGLSAWEGAWLVDSDRMALQIDGRWTADGELDAGWFQPTGSPVPLAQAIPKSQTVTLRGRVNFAKVFGIPSFLRKRFMPKRVPGPLGPLLPPLESLLKLLNGDVALTLLGLDPEASLDDALAIKGAAELLQSVHAGLVFGVNDPEAARAAITRAREQLQGAGWSASTLEAGGWRGVALRPAGSPGLWSIMQRGDQVAILTGGGEVARFVQVAEGTATSLEEAAQGEVAKAAVSAPDTALGLSVNFRRITRELAQKGFPPFFLQMVNDLRAISGAITLRPEGASVALEVRL